MTAPARVLAIGAHPDDIEFGAGATLAKWAAAGSEIHLLVLTDGSKGSWDPDTDPAELVATRAREANDAAVALGGTGVTFLDAVDGELSDSHDLRGRVCAAIRAVKPDLVLGHDPWKRYRVHPDHEQAGRITIGAIVAARDPHFFPEQGITPWRPHELWLFEPERVDVREPVGAFLDTKISALLQHRSQWRSTMDIDPADPRPGRDRFRDRILADARQAGGDGEPAEAFARITDL